MNTISNRQAVCDALIKRADTDKDIVVLFSDSRGSASMDAFISRFPDRVVETGIAEQNLVGIAAGLASCGKKPYVFSPACFLTARGYEQIKVDVAYSRSNVKLIGISGGVSYGALGMTHHSVQDIAAMASIPNMRVYLPSDRFQTGGLIEQLALDALPAYVRIGRNAVEDIYSGGAPLRLDKAALLKEGSDIGIIACGETVKPALDAAHILESESISARVLDMYCVKPLDAEAVLETSEAVKRILVVEEHVGWGGLGSAVAQITGGHAPVKVRCLAFPDEPLIAGSSKELFAHYRLDAVSIADACRELCLS